MILNQRNFKMSVQKHMWETFIRRRIKIKACANCGEVSLPSNNGNHCEPKDLNDSQIMKAGFQLTQTSSFG
jgi:uncharacterized OB-fold protein